MLNKRLIFSALSLIVLSAVLVSGQGTTGEISGKVKDPQGAAVPGATITATNLDTPFKRQVTTNGDGDYRFVGLPVGRYEVRFEHQGFKTGIVNLKLTVAEERVANFDMEVGTFTEQVIVNAIEGTEVETGNSTLSGLVDEKKIRDLPLNGRDMAQLILLEPGVVNSRGSAQTSDTGRGTRFSVAGARPSQNLFQLDGTTINDALNNTPGSAQGLLVGVETVKEFRVLTTNYSAEYGRATGGVFIAVTKSGTNQFHGSGFEFLRNDVLDAANFFDNASGLGKGPFRRNQFGFTVGGPVMLPFGEGKDAGWWVRWRAVESFFDSGPRSRHFVRNPITGRIQFGDGIKGMMPPAGRNNIVARRYQIGGGVRGNVNAMTLTQLTRAIAYIDKCYNAIPAAGGADAETVDEAKSRAPQLLKSRDRAVTAEDFETLALRASTAIARAKCLASGRHDGHVLLVVVPRGDERHLDLTRRLTGRRPTDGYFRAVTELGQTIASGGFEAIAGVQPEEILMPYKP